MSDVKSDPKAQWVERVLGVEVPEEMGEQWVKKWDRALIEWRDASWAVDNQLKVLAAECRKTNDPWLERIAVIGLPSILRKQRSDLDRACDEISRASPDKLPEAVKKARQAASEMANGLKNPQVAGCDANPFNVSVGFTHHFVIGLRALNGVLQNTR